MLAWLFTLVTLLLVEPVLFALAHLAKRVRQQKRQGFARRPALDPTAVDAPAPLTRKKPDWVVHEVLRLKALMGKQVGCRKVADTFNRLHAPTRVGKSFVSDTIRPPVRAGQHFPRTAQQAPCTGECQQRLGR